MLHAVLSSLYIAMAQRLGAARCKREGLATAPTVGRLTLLQLLATKQEKCSEGSLLHGKCGQLQLQQAAVSHASKHCKVHGSAANASAWCIASCSILNDTPGPADFMSTDCRATAVAVVRNMRRC
jgi:hypothetical protein